MRINRTGVVLKCTVVTKTPELRVSKIRNQHSVNMNVDDEEKGINLPWNVSQYSDASKRLFTAVQEDLAAFKHNTDDIQFSTIDFPNVTCPRIVITLRSKSKPYDIHPFKLEVVYQYRTDLMLSSEEMDFSDESNSEMRLRPRIKELISHPNFSETGLLQGVDSKYEMGSLSDVYNSILDLLATPNTSHLTTHGTNALVSAWKKHHDDSCPCPFYYAMPCSWEQFNASDNESKKELLDDLKANLVQQQVDQYHTLQQRLNLPLIHYEPKNPKWFNGQWDFNEILHSEFLQIFNDSENGKRLFLEQFITPEFEERVYSFPLFTDSFCDLLSEELGHYENTENVPKDRPNSMNNYGVILNRMGLEPLITDLFDRYLTVIAQWIYPSNLDKGDAELEDEDLDFTFHGTLDHHHSFMVQYKMGADLLLDMHIDDSEVTFNVNLMDTFKGAALAVCGLVGESQRRSHLLSYQHRKGVCLIHSGRQRHGARSITEGERQNLIIWGRSSWQRMVAPHGSGKCACCKHRGNQKMEEPPDAICLSRTHDKDYDQWVDAHAQMDTGFTIENELDVLSMADLPESDNEDEAKTDVEGAEGVASKEIDEFSLH